MLAEAIASAKNQTVAPKEIIVEQFPGRENPDNQTMKINQGISKVTADAYVFMGDDDQLKPNFIERMSAEMEKTGADIVSSFFDDFGDQVGAHGPNAFPLCSTIVKKSIWEKVGGFPLKAGPASDALFYLLCLDAGAKWAKIGDSLYLSRVHKSAFSNTADWELSKRRKRELFGHKYDGI